MYFMLRFISFMVSLLPLKLIYVFSSLMTKTVFFFWRSKRKNIFDNYRVILTKKFGELPSKKLLSHVAGKNFEHYGKFSAEFLILKKLHKKGMIHIPFKGTEHVKEGLSRGKGHVMGTLHFGNWDAAGVMIANTFDSTWAVADDLGGGYSKYVQETRKKYGINVVLPNKNLRDIYRPLSENRVLNVLIDRPLPPGDKKGVEVEFFGKKAIVASAAARIILKSGASATVGYSLRKPGGFYGMCSPVINYSLTGEHDADLRVITQAMFNEAERIITSHPEQWYMFRRFWINEPANS